MWSFWREEYCFQSVIPLENVFSHTTVFSPAAAALVYMEEIRFTVIINFLLQANKNGC